MTLFQGSRYEYETVERVPNSHKGNVTYNYAIFPTPAGEALFNFTVHYAVDGDRLDLLAHNFYGDPEYWYVIAYANPEILYPDSIAVGTPIRIPNSPNVF